MLGRFFPRIRRDNDIADFLYGAIVAQARSPALYATIGVPDSVTGRFEMVVLHLVLLTRRLEPGGEAARATGQGVFDHFCRDMDNSLRELGIGDLKVPKHMREVGEAYFGRAAAYEPALASRDEALLAEAIDRMVFGAGSGLPAARALAAYALATAERLDKQGEDEIVADGPDFPEPGTFADEGRGQ